MSISKPHSNERGTTSRRVGPASRSTRAAGRRAPAHQSRVPSRSWWACARLGSLVSPYGLLRRVHEDQRGTISIVSVFAVLFLMMLLGMVMNVGRHVDGKLRMQNAADSAAYS